MRLPLSLGLALLLLFAVLLGGAHHHDLHDHPDCAVCAATHHAAAETLAPPSPAIHPPALPALFAPLVLTNVIAPLTSVLRSRAPPR
jgi:hypothetical protein